MFTCLCQELTAKHSNCSVFISKISTHISHIHLRCLFFKTVFNETTDTSKYVLPINCDKLKYWYSDLPTFRRAFCCINKDSHITFKNVEVNTAKGLQLIPVSITRNNKCIGFTSYPQLTEQIGFCSTFSVVCKKIIFKLIK